MAIMDLIMADMKSAMKNKETVRLETLRSVKAAVKNAEIATGKELDEEAVMLVLRKESKKRIEAASEYENAGRHELAEKENLEKQIIESYLPALMSESDVAAVVEKVFLELKPEKSEMGKVMGRLMQELKGKADGKMVKNLVSKRFEQL